jgi:outer membrane receptor protein involved in Fe transport
VDYYDIDLTNAIATLTPQLLVNRCRQQGVYCDLVTFSGGTPNSPAALVRTVFQNLNQLQTSGFDFEVNYALPLEPGTINFNLLATRLLHLTTTDVTGLAIERAGVTGNNVSGGGAGLPHWQINGLVSFDRGPLSLSVEGRFIDDGLFDSTLIGPEQEGYNVNLPNSINTNHVASAVYVNLGARYRFTDEFEIFAGVQNALDRDPPVAPSNQGSTNMILFDPLGRTYRLGLRMDFR